MANVNVISDTIQEFNGVRYYLCGYYYQNNGARLHREVWKYHNGEIPKGYHVHHIDGNRTNNNIDNLSIITQEEHIKHHAKEEARIIHGKNVIKLAIEKAPEWHKSEEGKKWHSKHAKESFAKRKPVAYTCTWCGKEYESMRIAHTGNHFCCNNHKAAYRRKKVKDENSKN